MKNLRVLSFVLGLAFFSAYGMSCGHSHKKSDQVEQKGKENTSKYICPMYCDGSGSHEAGLCPVCGMEYVLNEEYHEDGHSHDDHSHDGHNH